MAEMGRPSKLTPERLKKAQAYLKTKKADREAPFVEELAAYELNVDRHTIARWAVRGEDREWLDKTYKTNPKKAKLYVDFCSTIKKLADLQLLYLKIKGLSDKQNTVAIFLMKADHKMIETSRLEHTGKDGEPIEYRPIEVLSTKDRKPTQDNLTLGDIADGTAKPSRASKTKITRRPQGASKVQTTKATVKQIERKVNNGKPTHKRTPKN